MWAKVSLLVAFFGRPRKEFILREIMKLGIHNIVEQKESILSPLRNYELCFRIFFSLSERLECEGKKQHVYKVTSLPGL